MKGWIAFAFVVGLLLAFVAGDRHGAQQKDTEWKAKTYQELAEASEAARDQQTMWQEVVNGTVRNSTKREAGLRAHLDAALDELRQRPQRPGNLPDGTGPAGACAGGATGAELYREDGGFLAREAARAETIRGGLADCYQVIDALRQGAHHGQANPR